MKHLLLLFSLVSAGVNAMAQTVPNHSIIKRDWNAFKTKT